MTKLGPVLTEIHERLAGVAIECLPWSDFVDRYDTPGTLFYLDPPYWGSETDYGAGVFDRADFARLASHLARIDGRFILSVNDVPEMREVFKRFSIESVATRYTVVGGKWSEVAEIIVTGPHTGSILPAPDLLSPFERRVDLDVLSIRFARTSNTGPARGCLLSRPGFFVSGSAGCVRLPWSARSPAAALSAVAIEAWSLISKSQLSSAHKVGGILVWKRRTILLRQFLNEHQ